MSQEEPIINGDLLRLRRESRGWALSDLATRACMSVKQVRQLEEGGVSSFYSVAVKTTAAKKVAILLGISAEEVFGRVSDVAEPSVEELSVDLIPEAPDLAMAAMAQTSASEPVVDENQKSKNSLWVMIGLFAGALAIAAYLQPKDEPVAEAAPPLQMVPSEPNDAASSAEPVSPTASLTADSVSSKSASAASVLATNPMPLRALPAASTAVTPAVAASVASKSQ